ncbi:alpha/beta hydrolase [Nonomuraea typhae]|uniref:alpha/beta hydrolase n=1 Tax=Nonomuraea typhae TaxID=2603600 RepID=UPI0012F83ABA|nr:alpha/beta hydrolase [Nonomuraea typhae]
MSEVRVLVGPGVVADPALLSEIAEREFAALGAAGTVTYARTAGELLAGGPGDGVPVVIPGPEPAARALMAEFAGPVVWLDLTRADDVCVGAEARHLHGRGVEGLAWAIRHAVHRSRHPARRVAYGAHADQWAELYLPKDLAAASVPVIVLVHGGYWRSIWAADLMEPLAADLVGRGFAVWNLEYRRPDLHGWEATTADVAAGVGALAEAGEERLDLDRVAVAGHSAGAQLALRAAADGARVALAVSLAGVLDLVEGDRRWLSSGAVAAALGGDAEVYGAASPLARLPLKVRQLVVQGRGDDLDLIDFSRRYARAAKESGDDLTYLEMSGDHFAVIDPGTPLWRTTAVAIANALR